jgi:outer membrane immunogenic protein
MRRQQLQHLRKAFFLLAAAVAVASAGTATAQQAPWSGFYLGGHLGGSWGDFGGSDLDGFVGGLHGGYNLQNGNIVYGVEADISWSGADGKSSGTTAAGACPIVVVAVVACPAAATSSASVDLDWLASLRARLGVTFGNVLVYGTGGVGWGNVDLRIDAGALGASSSSNTHVGWVAGGGVEMRITRNISGRAEVLHYGLGSETYNVLGTATKIDLDTTVVRAGLSYHFN